MGFNTSISKLQEKLHALTGKAKNGDGSGAGLLNKKKAGSLTSIATKPLIKILGKYCYNYEKILGLEISPHYIRICQMTNSYGVWSLNQLASACMENQFTNMDIQLNQDLYVENLQSLLEKHNIKTKDVALSIPTSASIIKIINMPDMDEEDLAQAASMGAIWESMVQLSGGIHEYSVYYKILRRKIKPSKTFAIKEQLLSETSSLDNLIQNITTPTSPEIPSFTGPEINIPNQPETLIENILADTNTNLPAVTEEIKPEETLAEELAEEEENSMDVLFVATKLIDAMLYMDIAQRAGLNPIIMDAKCNALKHSFETNPEKHHIPHPYALLEFGADENYVYIIDNMAIAKFNINISEDEKHLITNPVYDNITLHGFIQNYAQQLQAILDDNAKQSLSGSKVYNIFVSSNTPLHVEDAGSEPLINIFINQLSEVMGGYKISPCTFCNHIEVPAQFARKVNAEGNLSAWATVLGLATYKLDVFGYNNEAMAIDRTNLMPGYMSQIKTRSTQILSTLAMAAVFAFVIVTSGSSFLIMSAQGYTLTGKIKTLEPVKGEYDEKNKELQKLSIVMGKVKSLDNVRSTLPSNQMQILTIYKTLTQSIPDGVWLSDVNFTIPKGDIKGNQIVEIKGNSINDQNILEFVKRLNDSGGFKKVSLKTMEVLEKKDKTPATPATGASQVKKFILQGDIEKDAGIKKLELLSSGAK